MFLKTLRLVVVPDYTKLNKFIKRPAHPFPTTLQNIDRIKPTSRFIAVVDCVSGYQQMKLSLESRELSCFLKKVKFWLVLTLFMSRAVMAPFIVVVGL